MKYILQHFEFGPLVESDNYREINDYLHDYFGENPLEMNNIRETWDYVVIHYVGGYTLMIKK